MVLPRTPSPIILSYTLLDSRAQLLRGTEFAEATCGSIRLNFIRIGAIIRRNTRSIYYSYSSACPIQNLFLAIARRILLLA